MVVHHSPPTLDSHPTPQADAGIAEEGAWAKMAEAGGALDGSMEWFCDVCTGTIDNNETRYDSTVDADWCCCPECYDDGKAATEHPHPLLPQTGPCPRSL